MKLFIFICFLLPVHAFSQDFNGEKMKGGDVIGRHIFGLATDYHGDPIQADEKSLIYEKSDFHLMLDINQSRFLISGFNQQIGSVYITQVSQKNNKLLDTVALMADKIGGLSFPTGGIRTNWNTVLMTESRLIDAANPKAFVHEYKSYFKGKSDRVRPYQYGWVSEIIVLNDKGDTKAIKNYALGRMFANQVLVMPDNKTIYLLDKLGNLYLFFTDQEKSLTNGTLYVVDPVSGLILLGKTSALKIKFSLRKADFQSIFKSVATESSVLKTTTPKSPRCKKPYQYINTVFGEECLQLKPKYRKIAVFFEPVRILAMKGISPLIPKNSHMIFDPGANEISIENGRNERVKYALGEYSEIHSKFIIEVQ